MTGAPSPPRTRRGTSSTASIRRPAPPCVGLMKGYMLKEVDTGTKDDKGNPGHDDRAVGRQRHRGQGPEDAGAQSEGTAGRRSRALLPLSLPDARSQAENGVCGVELERHRRLHAVEIEVGRKAVVKAVDGHGAHLDDHRSSSILATILRPVPPRLLPSRCTASMRAISSSSSSIKSMDHVNRYDAVTAQTCRRPHAARPKPFDDPKVRKAMRLATDQAKTLQMAHRGIGTAAEHHHVSPVHPDYKKLPSMTQNTRRRRSCWPRPASRTASTSRSSASPIRPGSRRRSRPWPSSGRPAGHPRQDQHPAVGQVLGSLGHGAIRLHRMDASSAGLHGAGACLPHRRAVERVGLFQQGVRRTARQGRRHARCDKRAPRSSASSRRSCRRTGRSPSRCGVRSMPPIDKRVQGFQIHPTLYIFGEELAIQA